MVCRYYLCVSIWTIWILDDFAECYMLIRIVLDLYDVQMEISMLNQSITSTLLVFKAKRTILVYSFCKCFNYLCVDWYMRFLIYCFYWYFCLTKIQAWQEVRRKKIKTTFWTKMRATNHPRSWPVDGFWSLRFWAI